LLLALKKKKKNGCDTRGHTMSPLLLHPSIWWLASSSCCSTSQFTFSTVLRLPHRKCVLPCHQHCVQHTAVSCWQWLFFPAFDSVCSCLELLDRLAGVCVCVSHLFSWWFLWSGVARPTWVRCTSPACSLVILCWSLRQRMLPVLTV
jgi:hypothetical protein